MENKYKEEKEFISKVVNQIIRPAIENVAKHLEDHGYKPNAIVMISVHSKFEPSMEISHSCDTGDIKYLILFTTSYIKVMMAKLAKKDHDAYLKLKKKMRAMIIMLQK